MAYDFSRAKQSLSSIAVVKQDIFEHSKIAFDLLRACAINSSDLLSDDISKIDKRVQVEFKDINQNEFWLRFGGDLLIFSLHSNVFSFERSHSLFNTNYIAEDHSRAYFCMIEVFNFLNDSVKYSRMQDVGEMVCRIFINKENKFFIEGMGAIGSLFTDLPNQVFAEPMIDMVVENCITTSINYDLWAPPFNDVRFIPLYAMLEKNGDSPRKTAKRLGFQAAHVIASPQMKINDES
jgi:hypothetical protein